MNQVITTERVPIKMWLDDIEDGALEQAKHLANLPFAFHHVALMPDAHRGYGMPIGGVLATTSDVVIPNAIGMDIGCGMCAVRTSITDINTATLKQWMSAIRDVVPVGLRHHEKPQADKYMPEAPPHALFIVEHEYENALTQLGTLGGGNHFIEIQQAMEDNHIWIMIHSGSRNLGFKVANHYNKQAVALNKKWYTAVPAEWELAFLPVNTQAGDDYLAEMKYCVAFAYANRMLMMGRVIQCLQEILSAVTYEPAINIAHNYAAMEHHFGKNVMVHRKGATKVQDDITGIIPGSQGTNSYIVEGTDNQDSFFSCSHGAGRKIGRRQAIRTLDLRTEQKALEDKGIIHSVRNRHQLDEAPGAYKDIEQVMVNQSDLVVPVWTLKPLGVIKG